MMAQQRPLQPGTAGVVTETAARADNTKYYIKNQTTGQEWSITTATTHTNAAYQALIDASVGSGKITVAGNTGTMTFTGATDFGNFTINTSSGASANTGAAATTLVLSMLTILI